MKRLEILASLLEAAWSFSCQNLPANREDFDKLFVAWNRQLEREGIHPYFWAECFEIATNERVALTAPYQPAEVVQAWRKYGAKMVIEFLKDIPFEEEIIVGLRRHEAQKELAPKRGIES